MNSPGVAPERSGVNIYSRKIQSRPLSTLLPSVISTHIFYLPILYYFIAVLESAQAILVFYYLSTPNFEHEQNAPAFSVLLLYECQSTLYLESVTRLNLLCLGILDQNSLAGLSNCQRLQGSGQFSVWNRSLVFDLLVRHGLSHVEEKKQTHLIGVDADDVLPVRLWPGL